MKKILMGITILGLFLFLVACGQGEDNGETTPIDNTGNQEGGEGTVEEETNETGETTEEATETEEDATDDTDENNEEDVAVINNVSLYFADDQIMGVYRVDTDHSFTKDEAGVKKAYELWLEGPSHDNLVSLVPANTKVQSVDFIGNVAHVSFSADIFDANLGSGGEAMLLEQIAMIAEQFGYDKTQILVDGEVPGSLLGHMDASEPIEAGNPSDYQTY
ncbi:MAG: GerMN domain-containing protein [Bacillus sp. (in: Bacteria)]|nr:GerMN domain-containing protein [Bacillus sp. (in: firmicutes)]